MIDRQNNYPYDVLSLSKIIDFIEYYENIKNDKEFRKDKEEFETITKIAFEFHRYLRKKGFQVVITKDANTSIVTRYQLKNFLYLSLFLTRFCI